MISSPIWIRLCALSALLAGPALAQAPDGAIYEGDLTLISGDSRCGATGSVRYRARIQQGQVHVDTIPVAPPGPELRDTSVLPLKHDGSFGRVRRVNDVDVTSRGRFTADGGSWEVLVERDNAVLCHHRVELTRR